MTITTQHLIDAAKAIGIEVYTDKRYPHLLLFLNGDAVVDCWDPRKDKSQLMDLQFGLRIKVRDNNRAQTFISYDAKEDLMLVQKCINFSHDNFESFASAIILAAAEIGRGTK